MKYDFLAAMRYSARIGFAMVPILIIIAIIVIFLMIFMGVVRCRAKTEGKAEATEILVQAETRIEIETKDIEISFLQREVDRLTVENQEFRAIRKRNLATWGE